MSSNRDASADTSATGMKRSTEINRKKVRIKMEDVEEISTDTNDEESSRKKTKAETDDEDKKLIKAETDDEDEKLIKAETDDEDEKLIKAETDDENGGDSILKAETKLTSEGQIEADKVKHPGPLDVAEAKNCQIDPIAIFRSKYGTRVNHTIETKVTSAGGSDSWAASIIFNSTHSGGGWQKIDCIGPDFRSPIGIKDGGSASGYKSKAFAINAAVLKYLSLLHPEEITSWSHCRSKTTGEINDLWQVKWYSFARRGKVFLLVR